MYYLKNTEMGEPVQFIKPKEWGAFIAVLLPGSMESIRA